MAHFAELDQNNEVLRVVVIGNDEVENHGGDQSETAAKRVESIVPFSENGVKWVQTSYNNNFRKVFAGIGFIYDPVLDIFNVKQPYPSWTLDAGNDWRAPFPEPDPDFQWYWDEDAYQVDNTQGWVKITPGG